MKDLSKELLKIKKKIDGLKVEFSYTLIDDVIAVNNYRAENTTVFTTKDGTASQCDVGEEAVQKFALSIGLVSIEGEAVTDENLSELITKHCENLSGMSFLYYRMIGDSLKKK